MDQLIKSLFEYGQYIVLGALGVALLAYFLAVWHPLGRLLISYAYDLEEFWLSDTRGWERRIVRGVQMGVAVGVLYYLGVAAVVFSYWFVEPVRFAVLDCVYDGEQGLDFANQCGTHKPYGNQAGEVGFFRALRLPFTGHLYGSLYGSVPRSNNAYLRDEALIDSQPGARIHSVLSDELTFARLLRATAMFASAAAFISLFKTCVVLVLAAIPRLTWLEHDSTYENFIDEGGRWLKRKEEQKRARRASNYVKFDTEGSFEVEEKSSGIAIAGVPLSKDRNLRCMVAKEKVIWPQVILLFIAVLLYGFAVISYRTIEFEYSSLVRHAADDFRLNRAEQMQIEIFKARHGNSSSTEDHPSPGAD